MSAIARPTSATRFATEPELLDQRRHKAGTAAPPRRNGVSQYRALALSGGGIRSATFSLGALEAVSKDCVGVAGDPNKPGRAFRNSRLSSFDYLSTVSGGSFLGGFLCSLFRPDRLRKHGGDPAAAADDAVAVLNSGPPGRIRSAGNDPLSAPLAWLRENGRYLTPGGTGDAFYVAALGIRNWLALHYVIGGVLVAALALVGVLKAIASGLVPELRDFDAAMLGRVLRAYGTTDSSLSAHVWWSSFFPIGAVPVVAVAVPLGIAFWFVSERPDGKSRPINVAVLASAAVSVLLLGIGWGLSIDLPHDVSVDWLEGRFSEVLSQPKAMFGPHANAQHLLLVMSAEILAAVVVYIPFAAARPSAAMQRVLLTRGLATTLVATVCLVSIAILDTLGQSIYVAAFHGSNPGVFGAPAGLAAVLVWLVKRFAAKSPGTSKPAWLAHIPLHVFAGFGGILIFVLVGAVWAVLVQWLAWSGAKPAVCTSADCGHVGLLCGILAVAIVLSAITGHFPGFINQSSLQPFYSARLTRAYLGASNGKRFSRDSNALSAAEPLQGDNLTMDDYFGPPSSGSASVLKTFAPLHIINVTVNKTVDPAEQLVQRDRKGQPMAVLPCGFSIDTDWHDGYSKAGWQKDVTGPMSVGQWMGTSGAAFSTGIGRETSLGMSLLMGAANVRLGTWWESGLGIRKVDDPIDFIVGLIGSAFKTQSYLSYELRARFFGTRRSLQYLSDGGHFDNTGIYELLRAKRRVYQVFASDNGADPHYRFEDLANLIRLARIDLDVDIQVQTEFDSPLKQVFAGPDRFGRTDRPAPPGAIAVPSPSDPTPCALLLWATRRGETSPCTQIVLLKPHVTWDVAADVRQYAVEHPEFPQEPTADQFFDEAQWESYRALGCQQGGKVFNAAIIQALEALARDRMPGLQ